MVLFYANKMMAFDLNYAILGKYFPGFFSVDDFLYLCHVYNKHRKLVDYRRFTDSWYMEILLDGNILSNETKYIGNCLYIRLIIPGNMIKIELVLRVNKQNSKFCI